MTSSKHGIFHKLLAPSKPKEPTAGHKAAPIIEPAFLPGCTLQDFKLGRIVGTGSFGRVYIATHLRTNRTYAIKALSKTHLVRNQQVAHAKAECEVLKQISHPFVINLRGHFQDEAHIYLVMDFVAGGEFFTHLKSKGRLHEDTARFYAAEVILALEHLHSLDIVYRDLKPENLLVDASGHIRITDFGFAKHLPGNKRTFTVCGTPDYLAPEVILNKGHGKAVDWWAVGVLIYEMLAGYPPFYDDDTMNTYRKILRCSMQFPADMSPTARDLISKLIQVDLSKRIGTLASGVADIKQHPWFRGFDWSAAAGRGLAPPIRPVVRGADDTSNFDDYSHVEPLKTGCELSPAEQALFAGF